MKVSIAYKIVTHVKIVVLAVSICYELQFTHDHFCTTSVRAGYFDIYMYILSTQEEPAVLCEWQFLVPLIFCGSQCVNRAHEIEIRPWSVSQLSLNLLREFL